MTTLISIYKSQKKEGMYIYLKKDDGIASVPEALIKLFGTPVLVTHMKVDKEKQFAKFNAMELFSSISEKGFYLQMPEPLPEYREFVVRNNDKLGKQ